MKAATGVGGTCRPHGKLLWSLDSRLKLAGLIVVGLAALSAAADSRPGGNAGPDPVAVQQNLLRFADTYLTRMTVGLEELKIGEHGIGRADVLKWKIGLATETCSIAASPSALAGVLDMTIFVTVTRKTLEEHWQKKTLVESAQPLIASSRNSEAEIWQFAGTVLTQEQLDELHRSVETWLAQNTLPEDLLAARALGFASREYKGFTREEPLRFVVLVEGCVLVKVKAVDKILPIHKAQLLSYMKLLNVPVGLLINFHELKVTDGISRLILPGAGR